MTEDMIRRDDEYWAGVARAVGKGTPSILLGTSTRSLKKNLDRLRQAAGEEDTMGDTVSQALSSPAELARWVEVHHGDHPEWADELRALLPVSPSRWDPVPHLAALIDGLREAALAENAPAADMAIADLLLGPYARLRGGLLLDEPGREGLSTEQALREVVRPA